MADRTLTINHADGGSETYTLKTEDVLGVRSMQVDGETVTVDRTAPDLVRTIIADGQTITIDTTREGVRTLTVDGTEITLDRTEESNLDSFLQEFTGAAAAYSLRDLASASGNTTVVRVRRASDNAEADFTASQITGGQMVDWITRTGDFSSSGYDTFSNNATGDGFTATTLTTTGRARYNSAIGTSGDVINVTFDIVVVSGSPNFALRQTNVTASNEEIITTSGSKSIVLTATSSFNNLQISEGDDGADFTISNIRIDKIDGFVETWYDQSGNNNDAVQLTAGSQPKIVDAGALVVGGIDFDGVDDYFDFSSGNPITSIDAASAFFVGSSDSSGNQCGLNISSSSSQRFYLPVLNSGSFRFGYADSLTAVTLASSNTSEHLFTGIAGTSTASGYYDGELKGTVSSGTGVLGSGEIGSIGSSYRWDGRMREIIIYDSDQSANRAAIETNINNQYDIY